MKQKSNEQIELARQSGYNEACFVFEEKVKKLKEELNSLLINSNKVCGQALLNKKDEGYSEEHIFDNFFRRMQNGIKEEIDKIMGKFGSKEKDKFENPDYPESQEEWGECEGEGK